MCRQFIPRAVSLLAAIALLAAAGKAMAGSGDFEKPITVDAKSQFIDGKKKKSVFKDDVKITQGSLIIAADEVEAIASDGEGKEIFIARGKPASYSQTLDDGAKVKASANEIRYEVAKQLISLQGDAKIQQDTSMVQGDSITYDMSKEQLLATGGESNSNGRVTTVFRPDTVKELKEDNKSSDSNENEGN